MEYIRVASRNHTSDECTASPVGGASSGNGTANGTVTGVPLHNVIPLPSLIVLTGLRPAGDRRCADQRMGDIAAPQ